MNAAVCGPRLGPVPDQGVYDDAPETRAQAAEFERTKRRYLSRGLCHYCASNAAYGHALGFSRIEPPRAACAMLVFEFPIPKPNGWRALPRERPRGLRGDVRPTGLNGPGNAHTHASGPLVASGGRA